MAQIDDFFMYENRVEGITDADYQRVQPYVEAAQAFAQTTYPSSATEARRYGDSPSCCSSSCVWMPAATKN